MNATSGGCKKLVVQKHQLKALGFIWVLSSWLRRVLVDFVRHLPQQLSRVRTGSPQAFLQLCSRPRPEGDEVTCDCGAAENASLCSSINKGAESTFLSGAASLCFLNDFCHLRKWSPVEPPRTATIAKNLASALLQPCCVFTRMRQPSASDCATTAASPFSSPPSRQSRAQTIRLGEEEGVGGGGKASTNCGCIGNTPTKYRV